MAQVKRDLELAIQGAKKEARVFANNLFVKAGTNMNNFSPELTGRFKRETLYSNTKGLDGNINSFRITNDVPYQNQVEFVGWKFTPPYQPFAKTREVLHFAILSYSREFNNKRMYV